MLQTYAVSSTVFCCFIKSLTCSSKYSIFFSSFLTLRSCSSLRETIIPEMIYQQFDINALIRFLVDSFYLPFIISPILHNLSSISKSLACPNAFSWNNRQTFIEKLTITIIESMTSHTELKSAMGSTINLVVISMTNTPFLIVKIYRF